MSNTLLEQIIQNQNKQSEQMGSVTEAIKAIPRIEDSLKRIESKHNQDYLQYVKSNQETNERIDPIEQYVNRKIREGEEEKKNVSKFFWDIAKQLALIVIGGILVSWRTIINNIK